MSNHNFLRQPQSPHSAFTPLLRKPLIVEMLSSPPPLNPHEGHCAPDDFSLLRDALVLSRSSSFINSTDWTDVTLGDLTESNKLIAINSLYSVQRAFETLIQYNLTSVPVSLSQTSLDLDNCLLFDYSDLTTYLLLIMNRIAPADLCADDGTRQEKVERIQAAVALAKKGGEVPVDLIVGLHPKNPFFKFAELDSLLRAVEAFGNGVHRVAIVSSANKITGILLQRRTIRFFWENARRFPLLEVLWNSTLQELKIGLASPLTIQGEQPLIEALEKMFSERVSLLAVIDRNKHLIGNISIVDVKNVSLTKNLHLLFKPVTNFISYNLSQKGIERGQDQFPIFHVSQTTSLGRVVAKLVATQSHRLWVVELRLFLVPNTSIGPSTVETALGGDPAAETGRPGKLIGVVTLTDILGLFAHTKAGVKVDPLAARNHRRRSSTSTTRSSFESVHAPPSTTTLVASTPQHHGQDIPRKSHQSGNIRDKFGGE